MTRSPTGRLSRTRSRPASRPGNRARVLVFSLGAFLFAISLVLHPLVLDPAAESAAYRTIAAYGLWSAIHWCALVGLTLWTLPLVGDAATSPAARQALAVGLALWAMVLSFEAVALPRLAVAGVPGLWGWTLAVGYLGAVFDGVGLALLGWPDVGGGRLLPVLGTVVAAASVAAFTFPSGAVPVLAAAGAAGLTATAAAVRRWL